MIIPLNYDLAAAVNRITLGTVVIAHSLYLKFFIFTLPGTAEFFSSIGLPGLLAYVVFFLEAVCGIALISGFQSQLASIILIPVLLGAAWAHWGSGWLFSNQGGGWEYPLVLVLMAVVQAFLGNGKYAITQESADAK